jgi:hypothetical protein
LISISLLHGWSERLQVLSDVSMGVLEIYFGPRPSVLRCLAIARHRIQPAVTLPPIGSGCTGVDRRHCGAVGGWVKRSEPTPIEVGPSQAAFVRFMTLGKAFFCLAFASLRQPSDSCLFRSL